MTIFSDLKNKYPDLFLGIVGDGPDSSKLKNEIKRLHLMDNVEFYGFIPPGQKLVDLYDFYNIFVLPSFTEGLPRAIFEAMARGNIVVSAKVGSIASFIENGVNGFLFFPYHKQDMEEAIAKAIRLLADSKAHHDLMVNARAGLNQVAFDTRSNLMLSYFKRCLAR